ncbi:MAG TPA: hypothetical protein VGC42_07945, partial [Kofleriaceae bacterium]
MKVATRITAATAIVVALVSASYASYDLRSRRTERRMALEREARAVATALRFDVESQPSAFRAPSEAAMRDLSRAAAGWRVSVLPSSRVSTRPGPDETEAQLRRLNAMILVPKAGGDLEADSYYYDLPIRAVADRGAEPAIIGMIEVSKVADVLEPSSDD